MIIVNKESLLSKIEKCYESIQVNDKNSIIAETGIRIIANGNILKFITINEAYSIMCVQEIDNADAPFDIIVNGIALYTSVKAIRNSEVSIDKNDVTLKVFSEKQKFNLNYKIDNILNIENLMDRDYNQEINKYVVQYAMAKSIFNTSKDVFNPILSCVYFGTGHSISTDGPRFTAIPIGNTPLLGYAIPKKVISIVLSCNKGSQELVTKFDGQEGCVYFKIGESFYIKGNLYSEKYPGEKLESLIENYGRKIVVNTKELLDIINSYVSLLNDSFNKLTMKINEDGVLEVAIETDTCSAIDNVSIIDNVNVVSNVEMSFNYKLLVEILRELKESDTINFYLKEDDSICCICDKDDSCKTFIKMKV